MRNSYKSDADIQHDVMEELKWDTRVTATDVGVEVKRGIVTLTGTVDSWAARVAAQEAAHRVSVVTDVANDIKVKLPGSEERDDTDIAKAVRGALEWDVLVPHDQITTTVSKGVVMLEGTVSYWSQHDDAGRCVRNLAGVREVINAIKVTPPQVSPHEVRTAIDSALDRRADRASKRIQVAVTGTKVTLTGSVPSWMELEAVEGAVRGTPGVHQIQNDLTIQPQQ